MIKYHRFWISVNLSWIWRSSMGIKYELQWFIYSKGQIIYWVAALINLYSWWSNKNMGSGVSILFLSLINPQWNMQDNIKIRFAPCASWLRLGIGNLMENRKYGETLLSLLSKFRLTEHPSLEKGWKRNYNACTTVIKQKLMIVRSCKSSSFLFFNFLWYRRTSLSYKSQSILYNKQSSLLIKLLWATNLTR